MGLGFAAFGAELPELEARCHEHLHYARPTVLAATEDPQGTRVLNLFARDCSAAGLARRAGQDAAGGRAEGVPRSKCVLLEILHPHVQEQAAESLRLARYGPAKMGGAQG